MVVTKVDELYRNAKHYDPRKRTRFKMFCDSYEQLLKEVIAGKKHTDEELLKHPYCDYLKTTYREQPFASERWKRHFLKKIKDGINLYHDIKDNGMKNPVEVINEIMVRGNRRVIVAKLLGITEV